MEKTSNDLSFSRDSIRVGQALFTVLAALVLFLGSCRDDKLTEDMADKLRFSADTVQFDTVFTTIGSVTREFVVYNDANKRIIISNIDLAGGATSQFRINVDGIPGESQEAIEIAANDSIYVFVEVTVDPNAANLPYVVEDSVIFLTNGNRQSVDLVAWGQNANFFNGQRICDEVWTDDKPYVIYNSVQVDSNCTLTIMEGCRIHFHANSALFVDGTLNVMGTKDSMVTFEGDRLEDFFLDQPGQWDGIFFLRGSTGNIEWATIKNAVHGILSGATKNENFTTDYIEGNEPEVNLDHCYIHDHSGNGIWSLRSNMTIDNTLIYNVGGSCALLTTGGRYDFTHCTLASFGSLYLSHQTPLLTLANFFNFGQDEAGADIIVAADLTEANFTNCILEGSILEGKELLLADIESGVAFNHQFESCILRTDIAEGEFNNSNCLFNQDPFFVSRSDRDYSLSDGSPAIDAGVSTFLTEDLRGNARPFAGTLPDLGAFESGYE